VIHVYTACAKEINKERETPSFPKICRWQWHQKGKSKGKSKRRHASFAVSAIFNVELRRKCVLRYVFLRTVRKEI